MYIMIIWGMIGIGFLIFMLFLGVFILEKALKSKWIKKRRLKLIMKNKSYECIKLKEEELNSGFDFPLTLQDVDEFVKNVKEKRPSAVAGVEEIRLRNRPQSLALSVFGAYHSFRSYRSKVGATIDIYPLRKDGDCFRMYLFFKKLEEKFPVENDIQDRPYILISKEQAKKEMLHTLGHELGHSLIYNLEKKLHGGDIEAQCNAWAKSFGGDTLSYEERKNLIVYRKGKKLGRFEDVVS